MTVGQRPVRYRRRSLTSLPPENVRGWTVKRYAISALREKPLEPVHDFARQALHQTLPPSHSTELAYGFSVVHEDEDGCYVVVGWWSANRVILHTRTWIAEWAHLDIISEAPDGATACIWELVAVGHERDSWVRHVVQPEVPDLDSYLADVLQGWY